VSLKPNPGSDVVDYNARSSESAPVLPGRESVALARRTPETTRSIQREPSAADWCLRQGSGRDGSTLAVGSSRRLLHAVEPCLEPAGSFRCQSPRQLESSTLARRVLPNRRLAAADLRRQNRALRRSSADGSRARPARVSTGQCAATRRRLGRGRTPSLPGLLSSPIPTPGVPKPYV